MPLVKGTALAAVLTALPFAAAAEDKEPVTLTPISFCEIFANIEKDAETGKEILDAEGKPVIGVIETTAGCTQGQIDSYVDRLKGYDAYNMDSYVIEQPA